MNSEDPITWADVSSASYIASLCYKDLHGRIKRYEDNVAYLLSEMQRIAGRLEGELLKFKEGLEEPADEFAQKFEELEELIDEAEQSERPTQHDRKEAA